VTEKLIAALIASLCVSPAVFAQDASNEALTSQALPSVIRNQDLLVLPAGPAGLGRPSLPAPAVAATPGSGSVSSFEIGPEDILDISVWRNPELSRIVPVRPDGKVSLPLVNDIQAAGLTPATLRAQVTARLAEFIPAPEVSVMVREVHSRKVAVVGAVKTPGRFELRSPMTVLEVIALAQGLTDFAARDRIVVLRQNGATTTRLPFNYRKIADSADQENFFVAPGDIIVVP